MNREQAKKLLPIIQAFVDGGTVQYKRGGEYDWADIEDPMFYRGDEYRIKPKPLEFWTVHRTYRDGSTSLGFTYDNREDALAAMFETNDSPDMTGTSARVVHMRKVDR